MNKNKEIPIVDLFAGPGGLGEGFTSIDNGSLFKILVSAEMETSAHQTLTLRAFYRKLKNKGESDLESYYRFCNGLSDLPYDETNLNAWEEAKLEAKQIELGTEEGNLQLNKAIEAGKLTPKIPWVLIGGPPCQAYSLVGRSRNLGNAEYKAENDPRHFLYKEYLNIIQRYKPSVFVMENVKGILSAKVNGEKIFNNILTDLSDPDQALSKKSSGFKYKIYSLVNATYFESGMHPEEINANDFVIRAEDYGIPQARHRVILLGVRSDHESKPVQLKKKNFTNVSDAINGLPRLRSRLSKEADNTERWFNIVIAHLDNLYKDAQSQPNLAKLVKTLKQIKMKASNNLTYGDVRVQQDKNFYNRFKTDNSLLANWYEDANLSVWLNSETRGHMTSDLKRYLYAAAFASAYERSPKGHKEFNLEGLRPDHSNWESGKFSDRFRVQLSDKPSTTVTSHISKDGHYFIHPDPTQCRSLTVREAARLQTFPDNYFFLGNRTQQYHQVGNAVPPLLSYQIAEIVKHLLNY